jgi:peptidyl-prolyl cis-trans isomerase D
MLEFMRRNANSWIMILIFSVIIFVFAINFGPWAGNLSPSVPYAAVVNGEVISLVDFRTAYSSQFARLKQFRPEYDEAQADRDGLKRLVLDQLVGRELLTQLGKEQDLRIGARTLAEEIKERVFGPDTEFNKEEYKRRVNGFFQISIAQFEEQVKKDLLAQQVANILGSSVSVSPEELKTAFIERNTNLSVDFVKFSPQYYASKTPNGPAEVAQYIEANQKKLSDYYNAHLSDFIKDKQVRASHILVKVDSKLGASHKDEQKKKAEAILERIHKGEKFDEIASKESEDLGSKDKAGDLGFFTMGMMVNEFSEAAFALKNIDDVSNVVESPFGFHIIKLTDRAAEQKTELKDATVQIAEILMKEEVQDKGALEAARQALAQLKDGKALNQLNIPGLSKDGSAHATAQPFAPIADETPNFNLGASFVPKLGAIDEMREALFALTEANKVPANVIKANGAYYALRLKNRSEVDMAKFAESSDSLLTTLIYPRKRALMQQYLAHLKGKASIKINDAIFSAMPQDFDNQADL